MQVLGADHLLHHLGVVLRHVGSGATLLAHVDRLTEDDVAAMLTRLLATPADHTGCDDRYCTLDC